MHTSMWDLINQNQAIRGVREELKLALDTTTGGVLSPQSLEPKIVELVRKLSPFVAGLKVIQADGKTHEFNSRTALPTAYAEGEKANTPSSQSTYARSSEPLKIIRARGGVTGFQQAASKKFVDSYVKEIVGAAKAMAWHMEYEGMWGNKTADQYQYDGLDTKIVTNRIERTGQVITLRYLDDMIDPILEQGIDVSDLAFYLSPQMLSKISTLQTEVRIPITKVQFAGGLEMDSYRGIPLVKSSFVRPKSKMGTIVVADSATAGALVATKTYRWKVAAITRFGEQWASDEVSHTLGALKTAVDITFTPVADAMLYKVYRTVDGGGAGEQVIALVAAAKTYDADGTVTGTVSSITDGVADASLGVDKPLLQTGVEESIFLACLNPDESLEIASLLNEAGEAVQNLIQMLPLARVKDQEEFLLLSYQAMIYKGDIFNAMTRRVKVA